MKIKDLARKIAALDPEADVKIAFVCERPTNPVKAAVIYATETECGPASALWVYDGFDNVDRKQVTTADVDRILTELGL